MSTPPKDFGKHLAGAIAEDLFNALTPLDQRRVMMSIQLSGAPPEWFLKRLEARGVLPPRPLPRPLILGMVPWMFWTLLAVTAFAVFGPFIAVAIRHLFK